MMKKTVLYKNSLRPAWHALMLAASFGLTAIPSVSAQGESGILTGKDVALRNVIEEVAIRTGKVFVVHPSVNGTVTINAAPDVTLTPEETWSVFLATLSVRNLSAQQIGKNEYRIVPNDLVRRDAGSGFQTNPAAGESISRIIRLTYVDSRTTANSLKSMITDSGVVTPVLESNSLIIVDRAANVKRIQEVVRQIDVDRSIVKTVPLQSARASDVADVLRDMVAFGGEGTQPGSIQITAVDASNTLILRGIKSSVDKVVPIIADLDQTGLEKADLSVIYLKHADAEEVVPLLKELIDGGVAGAPNVDGAAVVKSSIVAHRQTNALIINADTQTQRIVANIVEQLDIRRPQVLIEAIIVNMSDSAARDIGIQYLASGNGSDGTPFISNSSSNAAPNILSAAASAFLLGDTTEGSTTVVNTDGSTVTSTNGEVTEIPGTSNIVEAAVSSLLSANGLIIGGGSQNSDGSIYGAILTAVQSDSNTNVLSTPSVMTIDNQTARLQVGQEIPVTSGEAVGSDLRNSFRSVEREEIGVILEVTPQISTDNTIKLDIVQEVSSIAASVQTTNTDFITNKSTITTSALAEDGQILVLGGLIDNTEEFNETKIPFLGDIPFAGHLFKTTGKDSSKRTLLVFIKPTIVRDGNTANAVTSRKYNFAAKQQRLRSGNDRAEIDRIIEEYLGKDSEFGNESVLGDKLQDILK